MASQTFTTLWKALVGAFLALFAALGFAAPAANAAAAPVSPAPGRPQSNDCEQATAQPQPVPHRLTAPARVKEQSLPPTMKQRIRAEQHGSSPSCRQLAAPTGLAPLDPGLTELAQLTKVPLQSAARAELPAAAPADTDRTTRSQAPRHPGGPREIPSAPAIPALPVQPGPGSATPATPGVPGPASTFEDTVLPQREETTPLATTARAGAGIPAARGHHERAAAPHAPADHHDTARYATAAP
ncbi:DUF6344 domain-containing protein [Streptomyces sp. NPDC049954]|uniref:DUF6344 domain-containing protein n=1 Tax=Streptomyces sp. NPDC049954 TaxID=3155779 RepID=UPI00341C9C3F